MDGGWSQTFEVFFNFFKYNFLPTRNWFMEYVITASMRTQLDKTPGDTRVGLLAFAFG